MYVINRIRQIGIIPVVRAGSSDEALAAVEAIRAGGIPILEITLTVPGAAQVIAELTRRLGDDALIGAGTVLDADTARACIDAGARFIVSQRRGRRGLPQVPQGPPAADRADPDRGVSLENAAAFIAAGALALEVGADLVKGDASSITEKARRYVAAVASARR